MPPKRAQSAGAEFRRNLAYIPGVFYTVEEWAQFTLEGVVALCHDHGQHRLIPRTLSRKHVTNEQGAV
eukprot:3541798-Amphidinium_carterae.1